MLAAECTYALAVPLPCVIKACLLRSSRAPRVESCTSRNYRQIRWPGSQGPAGYYRFMRLRQNPA